MPCAPQPRCCSSFSIACYPAWQCCDCCEILLEYKSGGQLFFCLVLHGYLPGVGKPVTTATSRFSPPSLAVDQLAAFLACPRTGGPAAFAPPPEIRLPEANPWSTPRQRCFALGKLELVQKQLLLLYSNLQTLREANNYHSEQNKAISILLSTADEAN